MKQSGQNSENWASQFSILILLSIALSSIPECTAQSQAQPQSSFPVFRDPEGNSPPFVKVEIPPEPCGERVNGILTGVCLPLGDCGNAGGLKVGNCTYGFGECCKIFSNCSREFVEVDNYVTLLRPSNFTTTPCSFRLKKLPDVCQVRLDFLNFNTTSANSNGDCVNDQFVIPCSHSITVPDGLTTCGNLTNQHMYLTFGSSASIDLLPILTQARSNYTILATQIPCYSDQLAPEHCLQYYTKPTDVVRSFDFPRQQQNNQKYTVCVQDTELSESIKWTPCKNFSQPFFISDTQVYTADPESCKADWVEVNGGDKLCGSPFPYEVSSSWKPFTLKVNFDDFEIPQLPYPNIGITDAAGCAQIQANSGGMLTCDFFFPEGCICQYAVNLGPIVGYSDLNNTGFCLQYQI